ncbi:MAG: amino acid permease [Egibacteraceae bacterium]
MASEQVEAEPLRQYGTFEGVFVPTLLTILGVILFLRTGWVVGNAGLLGGAAIILMGYLITGATAFSLSAVATNTKLEAGGAYAIISKSLGIEAGGAIGIPLYLSQTLAVALYTFGFRDGWQFLFPDHPALLVDLGTFAVLLLIASISAGFAFRIQYVILALVTGSIISVAAAVGSGTESITWLGSYPGEIETDLQGTSFWKVFAVFFPATTGIMAGVNLSGELRDSRRAIPLGTLGAVGVSLLVYLGAAFWLARNASPDELVSNYLVMIDRAAWGPAVLGGLLGATFSSGLASLVGAPRILQALGQHGVLPRSAWFARRTAGGEPRHALWATSGIVLAALMLRNLNALAPIITLFFLITYGTINLVVLVEQTLDLPTFRPTLRLPWFVPLVGATGCIVAMVVVNPPFAALALVLVATLVTILIRRRLNAPFSDVRGELYAALAQWATRRALASRQSAERTWRPRVLVPVLKIEEGQRHAAFVRDVTYPRGAVKLVGVRHPSSQPLAEGLTGLSREIRRKRVPTSWSVIDSPPGDGLLTAMRSTGVGLSRPNIVFMGFPDVQADDAAAAALVGEAYAQRLGVFLLANHAGEDLRRHGIINLWIREQGPDWTVSTKLQHSHLAILVAYKLWRNWQGELNLLTAVTDEAQLPEADRYLHELAELARLPGPPGVHVLHRAFPGALSLAPPADLSIFALPASRNFEQMRRIVTSSGTPCAFVHDSGTESAFV